MTDLKKVRELIAACERDLRRTLSHGECVDLVMDNTDLSSDDARGLVTCHFIARRRELGI